MLNLIKNNKSLKNIITALIQQLVTIFCGLIVPRLIIKTYGSNVNGIITSITQFLGYITLLESGVAPIIKSLLYKPIVKKDKEQIIVILKSAEKFFRTIALIFIGYLFVLCIVFPIFYISDYNFIYTLSLVIIISISIFFEYFFGIIYTIYLQAEQKSYIVSIIKIVSKVLNTVCIVLMVLKGCGIHSVKLASSLIFVLTPLAQNYYVKKKYKINLKNVENKYKLKNKWDGLSQHIAAIIHNSVDVAVLTFFATPIEVSVYSVYMLVINSVKELATSLSSGIDALFGSLIAKEDYEDLNCKFKLYEFFFYIILAIMFSCTIVLIMPFINIYTKGINDANYYQPAFAFVMIFAQLAMTVRIPYNHLVLAAGHFKQMRTMAWVEAIVNIFLSIILVFKFGLIGVAIGTLVASLIRTAHFIIYASSNILNRSISETIKKCVLLIIEILIISLLSLVYSQFNIDNYFRWMIYAILMFILSTLIVLFLSFTVYKQEIKDIFNNIIAKSK